MLTTTLVGEAIHRSFYHVFSVCLFFCLLFLLLYMVYFVCLKRLFSSGIMRDTEGCFCFNFVYFLLPMFRNNYNRVLDECCFKCTFQMTDGLMRILKGIFIFFIRSPNKISQIYKLHFCRACICTCTTQILSCRGVYNLFR